MAEDGAQAPAAVARTPAADWLAATLAAGPVAVADVRRLAKEAGVTWHKLSRAADALPVVIEPAIGDRPACWRLPCLTPLADDGGDDAA